MVSIWEKLFFYMFFVSLICSSYSIASASNDEELCSAIHKYCNIAIDYIKNDPYYQSHKSDMKIVSASRRIRWESKERIRKLTQELPNDFVEKIGKYGFFWAICFSSYPQYAPDLFIKVYIAEKDNSVIYVSKGKDFMNIQSQVIVNDSAPILIDKYCSIAINDLKRTTSLYNEFAETRKIHSVYREICDGKEEQKHPSFPKEIIEQIRAQVKNGDFYWIVTFGVDATRPAPGGDFYVFIKETDGRVIGKYGKK